MHFSGHSWQSCFWALHRVMFTHSSVIYGGWQAHSSAWDDRKPEKRRWQPLRGPQRKPTISDYTDLTKVCHKWRISTWRQPLQPWPSVESRTHRWAPETDLQWGPRHLDIHRGKTPGTSGPLTLWLCCSWNKLLICLAGGELAPRLSLVSPKVFFSILSPMEFSFLAAVASGLLSWGHFISSTIIDLIAQIL